MSNVTKPRKYYFVKSNEIGQIPLVAGNVIALIDANGFYYDVEDDGAVVRRPIAGSREFIYARPDNAHPGEVNTLYICDTGETLVGTTKKLYELYVWDDQWLLIANNTQDINVSSLVDATVTYYITGSTSIGSTTGKLTKRSDVYVDKNGKITAPGGFGGGKADSAIRADSTASADTATSATQDSLGNNIAQTYIKSLLPNLNDSSVLITFGDNSTDTINTYVPPTVSTLGAGLAPIIPQDTTKNVLYRDGWKALDISGMTADSADKDSSGQQITSTYIKSLSFDPSTRELEVTKGNDTVVSPAITIPDTTYNDYSGPGNGHGLVPASTSGNAQRYLRVDGSWQPIPDYTGATGGNAGTAGLVKAPQVADSGKFLKGDGTWSNPPSFSGSSAGLVPTSTSSTQSQFLKGDGSWGSVPEYVGATSGSNGVAGLVNPAASADRNKFYRGDGQWSEYPTFDGTNAGIVPTSNSSTQDMFLQGNGQWGTMPVFSINTNGSVPGPSTVDSGIYLNASGAWSTPPKNTTGLSDLGSSDYTLTDAFIGDGTTVSYLLRYTPELGSTNVLIDGVTIPSSDYSLNDNEITFNSAPGQDSAIVIHYAVNAVNLKLLLTGGAEQREYGQTYTSANAYILNDKLYSNSKEVATVDSIPTVTVDTSFTASAGLTIVSKKYGDSYYITLDGTSDSSINAGDDIATSSIVTFNKTYAVGLVGSTPALFTLNGSSIICNTAISANDTIAVSFNALA